MTIDVGRVRSLIAVAIDVDESVIVTQAHLINDLGLDSLSSLEVLVRLEREFGISIPEADLVKLTSLENVVAYLESRASEFNQEMGA